MSTETNEELLSRIIWGAPQNGRYTRKDVSEYLKKCYPQLCELYQKFWHDGLIRIDNYGEIAITGKYADFLNNQRKSSPVKPQK